MLLGAQPVIMAQLKPMQQYLYLTVFIAGITSLAAEFTAERILARVFGTSNLVWSAIIGVILVCLAVGYYLGGRWADRSPRYETLFGILVASAFMLGIVPFISNPILIAAASAFDRLQLGVVGGAFAAVLALFSVPSTLLAMASPFAIRLSMRDASQAGNVAGRIYAISTMGSFLGAVLPSVVLIPLIGTTRTVLLFSGLLLMVAVFGFILARGKRALPVLILPLVLVVLFALAGSPLKRTAGQIYETESAYNYIEVLEVNGFRMLRLNDGQGVHSMYHPTVLFYGGPWEQFLVGPMFNAGFDTGSVQRIAIIGLAAGTSARQAAAIYPQARVDGYEIDPSIVEVANRYFGMTELPNLNVFVQDGRYGLAHSPHTYDIIAVDAYRPPYIPWHMTTREFFQIAVDHLSEQGVLVINVGRAPNDRRLIEDLTATIGSLLPSVHVMDIPNTFNSMVFATRQPSDVFNLYRNYRALNETPAAPRLLLEAASVTVANMQPAPQPGMVFTDDLAPIEWITNNMILAFILGGGVQELR